LLFNSVIFIPFAITVLVLYYVLPFRQQNRMLLIASCIFYGCWDWRYLILLLISTSIDFIVGQKLHDTDSHAVKRKLLLFSCVTNLAILGFFKYFNFFIDSTNAVLTAMHLGKMGSHVQLLLPVGISFYTFHAMSYTIDIYRDKLQPIRSFADYMLFVLYFPQLVAGPIARASLLIPQVANPRTIKRDQIAEGLWLIFWGYIKKCLIADNLAPVANLVFEAKHITNGAHCLLAIYAFAIQIYCDFSGYTDIARGLGKLMGFELSLNFNLPYIACNPPEFWQRWHISLSSWLRDYLYIPLGGNRNGVKATYRNLFITMVIGGLWHGAAWHFVLWGAFHGSILILHRLLFGRKTVPGYTPGRAKKFLSQICMFHLTCVGWLLFRVRDMSQLTEAILSVTRKLVIDETFVTMLSSLLLFGGILIAVDLWIQNSDDPRTRPMWNYGLGPIVVTILAVQFMLMYPQAQQAFLYFQF
jgi:alginate O-acetyltransferase complex protein AlgI